MLPKITPKAVASCVGLAAAALSFVSLMAVAEAAGYIPILAACFPVSIDGLMIVSARVALSSAYGVWVRAFASLLLVPGVAASIWANDVAHPGVPVVSWTPPLAFAAAVLLVAVITAAEQREERRERDREKRRPKITPKTTPRAEPARNTRANPPVAVKLAAPTTPAPKTTPATKGPTATEQLRVVFEQHVEAGTEPDLRAPHLVEQAGVGSVSLAQQKLREWRADMAAATSTNGRTSPATGGE